MAAGSGGREECVIMCRVSLGDDETVLGLDSGDGYTSL